MRHGQCKSRSSLGALPAHRLVPALLALGALLVLAPSAFAQSGGGNYLNATFCGDMLHLYPENGDFRNDACQLWKFVPDADGWSRLQLKRTGKFIDATDCSDAVRLNGKSVDDNGSCQLWKFVPDADGWSRLQLKRSGKFLDAPCSEGIKLSGKSTHD